MIKKTLFILIISFILFSCEESHNTTVTSKQFERNIKNQDVQLIDVRTPEEYNAGHIEGAENINIHDSDFEQQLNKLDKNETVYIYCKSGSRSSSAIDTMIEMGFKDITELNGGITAWRVAGKPVVAP